jgi:hypothetical protein
MKTPMLSIVATLGLSTLLFTFSAGATGLFTCDSGPKSAWQPQEKLEKQLADQNGWKIRRVKEDGGCYEVYAFDKNGDRVNAYYHPVTFTLVPNSLSVRKP